MNTTRVGKITDLLEACWKDITQIALDWPNTFQYITETDWKQSEPIYQASGLSKNARDLYESTRRNMLSQEINLTMASFVNEQQRFYYYEYLQGFLNEVNRINERLDEYFDVVDGSDGVIYNEAIKWDILFVRDAIFDIAYEVGPFLATHQSDIVFNEAYSDHKRCDSDSFIKKDSNQGINQSINLIRDSKTILEKQKPTTQGCSTISFNDQPTSFIDLFDKPEYVSKWIEILRDTTRENRKAVIDDAGRWIGKGKKGSISILIAWVQVLKERGWFNTVVTDSIMAELLNNHFPNLALKVKDPSIWRKYTQIGSSYHTEFLQSIPKSSNLQFPKFP